MKTADLPRLTLTGGPRARGLAHGEALGTRIAELLERWGDMLEASFGLQRARYVERFVAETRYEATTRRVAPSVLTEVAAIAEAAGVDYASLFAFQHVNEEFDLAPRFAGADKEGEACSTIAVGPTGDRPALIGQNLDLSEYLDGFQILFRYDCDQSAGEILALSVPGMIALNGLNSFGFAICDNALVQLRPDPDGVPIYALYRLLLESRSLSDARRLIGMTPHAAGLNWVIGDPDGVAMIERSGRAAVDYRPGAVNAIAYHTNHPLASTDWSEQEFQEKRPQPPRSSYLRLAALHQRLAPCADQNLTIEAIKAALSSRDDPGYPISRGGGANQEDLAIGFTLASSIFELGRANPRWHLAAGPGHRTDYDVFDFA